MKQYELTFTPEAICRTPYGSRQRRRPQPAGERQNPLPRRFVLRPP